MEADLMITTKIKTAISIIFLITVIYISLVLLPSVVITHFLEPKLEEVIDKEIERQASILMRQAIREELIKGLKK